MTPAPTETPSPIPTTPSTDAHQPPRSLRGPTPVCYRPPKSAVSCSRSPILPSLHQPDSHDHRTQRLNHFPRAAAGLGVAVASRVPVRRAALHQLRRPHARDRVHRGRPRSTRILEHLGLTARVPIAAPTA